MKAQCQLFHLCVEDKTLDQTTQTSLLLYLPKVSSSQFLNSTTHSRQRYIDTSWNNASGSVELEILLILHPMYMQCVAGLLLVLLYSILFPPALCCVNPIMVFFRPCVILYIYEDMTQTFWNSLFSLLSPSLFFYLFLRSPGIFGDGSSGLLQYGGGQSKKKV